MNLLKIYIILSMKVGVGKVDDENTKKKNLENVFHELCYFKVIISLSFHESN